MTLNLKQVIALVLVVLSVLTTSTAQLTDLMGPATTKLIVSMASLLTAILSGSLAVITSQSSMITEVGAMPGVEKITVNKQANSTLANLAVDPLQSKIEVIPGAEAAVNKTANA